MKGPFAARIELTAEFGRDGGRNKLARRREIVEAFEQVVEPFGNGGAAACCEPARRGDVRNRQDAGHDLDVDTGGRRVVAEAEKAIGGKEKLRNRAVGAGVDLALEVLEIELPRGRIRMTTATGRGPRARPG